ncbi:hypothetical protein BGW42_003575 [Actinomortierella wolfii]|nr:hypothetical protein BGW42_003575 [Actinomortierella wolfii]
MGKLTTLLRMKLKNVETKDMASNVDDNRTPTKKNEVGSATLAVSTAPKSSSLMEDVLDQLTTSSPDSPRSTTGKQSPDFEGKGNAYSGAKASTPSMSSIREAAANRPLRSTDVAHSTPQYSATESVFSEASLRLAQEELRKLKEVEQRSHASTKLRDVRRKANVQLPSDDEGSDLEDSDSNNELARGLQCSRSLQPLLGQSQEPQVQPVPFHLVHHIRTAEPLPSRKLGSLCRDPVKKVCEANSVKQTETEADPEAVLERMKERHRAALANHPKNRGERQEGSIIDECGLPTSTHPHTFSPCSSIFAIPSLIPMEEYARHTSYQPLTSHAMQQSMPGYSAHGYPIQQHTGTSYQAAIIQHLQQQQQQQSILQQQQLQIHQKYIQQHVASRRGSAITSYMSLPVSNQYPLDAYPPSTTSSHPSSERSPRPHTQQSMASSEHLSEDSCVSIDQSHRPAFSSPKSCASTDSGCGSSPEPENRVHLDSSPTKLSHHTRTGQGIDSVAEIFSELCINGGDGKPYKSNGRTPVQSPTNSEEANATVIVDTSSAESGLDNQLDDVFGDEDNQSIIHSRRGSIQPGVFPSGHFGTPIQQQTNMILAGADVAVAVSAAESLDYAKDGLIQPMHQSVFHQPPHQVVFGVHAAPPHTTTAMVRSPTPPSVVMYHHPIPQQGHDLTTHHPSAASISRQKSPATAAAISVGSTLPNHQHAHTLDYVTGIMTRSTGHGQHGYLTNVGAQASQSIPRRAATMGHSMSPLATNGPLANHRVEPVQQIRSRVPTEGSRLDGNIGLINVNNEHTGGPYMHGIIDPLPSMTQHQQLAATSVSNLATHHRQHHYQHGHTQVQMPHLQNHHLNYHQKHNYSLQQQQRQHSPLMSHPLVSSAQAHPMLVHHSSQPNLRQAFSEQEYRHISAAQHMGQASAAYPGHHTAVVAGGGVQTQLGAQNAYGIPHSSLAHCLEMHPAQGATGLHGTYHLTRRA